jgi:hypothetical protein
VGVLARPSTVNAAVALERKIAAEDGRDPRVDPPAFWRRCSSDAPHPPLADASGFAGEGTSPLARCDRFAAVEKNLSCIRRKRQGCVSEACSFKRTF